MVKVHIETAAVAQPSLGQMDPGQVGRYLGCCTQLKSFFNLLKESGLTGLHKQLSFSLSLVRSQGEHNLWRHEALMQNATSYS